MADVVRSGGQEAGAGCRRQAQEKQEAASLSACCLLLSASCSCLLLLPPAVASCRCLLDQLLAEDYPVAVRRTHEE